MLDCQGKYLSIDSLPANNQTSPFRLTRGIQWELWLNPLGFLYSMYGIFTYMDGPFVWQISREKKYPSSHGSVESYPPDLQRFVEILYPRSSSTTSGTGLVTLQAGFTIPKGASVRSSCPLLKHQKKRLLHPYQAHQNTYTESHPLFLRWVPYFVGLVGVLLLHDSDANSW